MSFQPSREIYNDIARETADIGPASNTTEYVKKRKRKLLSHLGLQNPSQNETWRVYRWTIPAIDGHHGIVFELLNKDENKTFDERSFSSELTWDFVDDERRVGLKICIPDEATSFKDGNLFHGEILQNTSVNDILNKSKECINSWREYNVIFYNCRHYADRLKLLLFDYNPNVQFMKATVNNCVYMGAASITAYYLLKSDYKIFKGMGLLSSYFIHYNRSQALHNIINGAGQNYYQKGGDVKFKLYRNIVLTAGFGLLLHFGGNKILKKYDVTHQINKTFYELGVKYEQPFGLGIVTPFNVVSGWSYFSYFSMWLAASTLFYMQGNVDPN